MNDMKEAITGQAHEALSPKTVSAEDLGPVFR